MPDGSDGELRGRMQRLESLLSEVDDRADPATKAQVREIVQSLMDYHGAAIEKMVSAMANDGNGGRAMLDELARDELVSSATAVIWTTSARNRRAGSECAGKVSAVFALAWRQRRAVVDR